MYVCSFWLAPQRALKQLLRRNIIAAVQLNYSTIIKRVGVPWQRQLSSHSRFSNGKIGASSSCYFRDRRILFDQRAKLISCFAKVTTSKLLVCSLKRAKRGRLIMSRLRWRLRWSWSFEDQGFLGANRPRLD